MLKYALVAAIVILAGAGCVAMQGDRVGAGTSTPQVSPVDSVTPTAPGTKPQWQFFETEQGKGKG